MAGLFGGGGSSAALPQRQTLDVNRLGADVTQADLAAIQAGIGAEERFTPETAELRTSGIQALLQNLGLAQPGLEEISAGLLEQFRTPSEVPQLVGSELLGNVRQQIAEELELGGQLSPEIRNLVFRTSAGKAGNVGVFGGQSGRDIVARDLGLTSIDIRRQRQASAERLGTAEQAINLGQQSLQAQINQQNISNKFSISNLLNQQRQQETNRLLNIAQFGQGIQRPTIGLGGADIANLQVAELNAANQFNVDQASIAAQQEQARRQQKSDLFGTLGGIAGSFLGGPAGGAIGKSLFS